MANRKFTVYRDHGKRMFYQVKNVAVAKPYITEHQAYVGEDGTLYAKNGNCFVEAWRLYYSANHVVIGKLFRK